MAREPEREDAPMHQPTFASVEFEQKKRKTRRELFLERIDGLVPWDEFASSGTRRRDGDGGPTRWR